MSSPARVAKLLGEQGRFSTTTDLIELTRRGIHSRGVLKLLAIVDLSQDEFVKAVRISARTLSRRLEKGSNLLPSEESEKALRLARVFDEASETLGSADKAKLWIKRSNKSLGNQAPLMLLDSDLGTEQIMDVLGRIRDGVYS